MTRGAADFFAVYKFEIASAEEATLDLFDSNPKAPLVLTDENEVIPTIHEVVEEGVEKPINRPPTASFSIMPENPEVGDYIVVASTSSDPDGDMLTSSWYLDGEHLLELDNLSDWEWTDVEAGEYTVTLEIEDGRGGSDEYSMAVTVVVGDGEDVGSDSNVLYFLLLLIPAAILVLIIGRRAKQK